jgi:hypothetical protein
MAARKVLSFRDGSRKQKTYDHFKKSGEAAARKYGRSAGLKVSTLSNWIGAWKRVGGSRKKEAA